MTKHIYMKSKIQALCHKINPDEKIALALRENEAQLATREPRRDSRAGREGVAMSVATRDVASASLLQN